MKFKIKYTKLGNQFFFISNLADWHFSCRKHYNKQWIKQTGPLTSQEKRALKEFSKIMRKYGFRYKNKKSVYLGIPFITFSPAYAWRKVKKWVNKNEHKKIKEIFKIFEPRFEKIWLLPSKQLKKAKQILEKKLKEKKTNQILEIISVLYKNKEALNKTIEIYLFASPPQTGTGGGANLGADKITFECSKISQKELSHILSVIFHEIAHLFEKKYFRPLLKKWVNNLNKREKTKIRKTQVYQEIKNFEIILNEMVVSSLLPEGYLSEKIFRENVKKKIKKYFRINFKSTVKPLPKKYRGLKSLRYYSAYYLYPLAKNYASQKKPLDETYIQKTYEVFRKFEGL